MAVPTADALRDAAKLADERDALIAELDADRAAFEQTIADKTSRASELEREISVKLGSPARSNGRQSRARRGGAIDDTAIVAFVQNSRSPVSAAEIGEAIGTGTSNTLSNHLRALVDGGSLKKTGERRGTKYST